MRFYCNSIQIQAKVMEELELKEDSENWVTIVQNNVRPDPVDAASTFNINSGWTNGIISISEQTQDYQLNNYKQDNSNKNVFN